MVRKALYFLGPARVEIREESLSGPGSGQLLVKTLVSGISPGTEMLIYRDQFPGEMSIDATISSLRGSFHYPLKYGYAAVGRVVAAGTQVPAGWSDRLVFAFQPHQSHFLATPGELLPIPENFPPEVATMLPNMETAVNFMLDGAPLLGEQVAVFGQGIVGLLLTALLGKMPLASLVTVDPWPRRRLASLELGAHATLEPDEVTPSARLISLLSKDGSYPGADLTYEVSGNPGVLDQALAVTGYHGRVIIGSWYGRKKTELDLGGDFHRSRIRLVSSQVSSIAPELTGRWTKPRLLGQARSMLEKIPAASLITQTFPFSEAAAAYDLLDKYPQEAIQIVLKY